jgi:hypothetical protein
VHSGWNWIGYLPRDPRSVSSALGDLTVQAIVDRDLRPGSFTETWDGRDGDGRAVASGVYFYRLESGKHALTRKAVLLK